jgi:hypothetical protein
VLPSVFQPLITIESIAGYEICPSGEEHLHPWRCSSLLLTARSLIDYVIDEIYPSKCSRSVFGSIVLTERRQTTFSVGLFLKKCAKVLILSFYVSDWHFNRNPPSVTALGTFN